jgi:hypothetical protein
MYNFVQPVKNLLRRINFHKVFNYLSTLLRKSLLESHFESVTYIYVLEENEVMYVPSIVVVMRLDYLLGGRYPVFQFLQPFIETDIGHRLPGIVQRTATYG